MDFSDDAHLAAAVAKNKKMLRGKRLSIARSDPKQKGKKGSADPSNHTGQVMITGSVSYLLHVYLCAVSLSSLMPMTNLHHKLNVYIVHHSMRFCLLQPVHNTKIGTKTRIFMQMVKKYVKY